MSPACLPLVYPSVIDPGPFGTPLFTPRHWKHSGSVASPGQNEQAAWGQRTTQAWKLSPETELQSITPRIGKAAKGIDKRVPPPGWCRATGHDNHPAAPFPWSRGSDLTQCPVCRTRSETLAPSQPLPHQDWHHSPSVAPPSHQCSPRAHPQLRDSSFFHLETSYSICGCPAFKIKPFTFSPFMPEPQSKPGLSSTPCCGGK